MSAVLAGVLQTLSQPENARRLRLLVLAVLSIWAVLALASLVWALIPSGDTAESAPPVVINPVSSSAANESAQPVNINQIVAWHLFGEAGADIVPVKPKPEIVAPTQAREGIEKGARQTRLDLALRGIVASTEDGLGHAIIEYQREQDVYAVEDKLPVPGKVTLAKVMPTQVVINNGGTYELLKLFDKSSLAGQVVAPARTPPKPAAARSVDKRSDLDASRLAASYRERLYKDPQSLSTVVGVSAVRKDGALVGYRVMPGQDRDQFAQLGFKSGDLVKSVNGIDLSSPANTMRLYNIMRSAGEAVFEVERGGQPVTLSVSLAQ